MRTLRQMMGCTAVSAAMMFGAMFGTIFGMAGEASAQVATCEGGGYEGAAASFGHNNGDAKKSTKDSASAACSAYCAQFDSCSENKPNCNGTVKMGRMTCSDFCWSYPCIRVCNASYICTCACSSNSAQAAIAAINVPLNETDRDDATADSSASEETLEALPKLDAATLQAEAFELAANEELADTAEADADAVQGDTAGLVDCEAGGYAWYVDAGGRTRGAAKQGVAESVSAQCSSVCAARDGCSDNKSNCKGTAKLHDIACYSPADGWYICHIPFTCTCSCPGNK